MPIYEYQCKNKRCKKVVEKVHRVDSIPKQVRCTCGSMARRIPSLGAIKCDSINDVKWLPSALETLPNSAQHISSRGEHERYLKENNLVCKG